jgi:hypothetical protein
MVATRNQLALRMILEVFGNGPGSHLEQAMVENKMMDVLAWLSSDDSVLKGLEFTDVNDNNNTKKLKYRDYHKILFLRALVFYKRAMVSPLRTTPPTSPGTISTSLWRHRNAFAL